MPQCGSRWVNLRMARSLRLTAPRPDPSRNAKSRWRTSLPRVSATSRSQPGCSSPSGRWRRMSATSWISSDSNHGLRSRAGSPPTASNSRWGSADALYGKHGGRSDDGAGSGERVQHAVAAATDGQDGGRERWRDRKRESARDVEHAEILGGGAPVRQNIDDKRKVDGQVDPETEPADRHANQETVEVAGDGDHEQRQAIHDRSGKNEDLPSAYSVREPATGERRGDEDGGLEERAEAYLLRDLGLSAADLLQQVIRLVGDQEGIGQDEHQPARERPREVGALSRIDIEGARNFP